MPKIDKLGSREGPRVFLSHASEDKDRFVVEFAIRLRNRGVDAWLDEWEMLPGDSLVDKIFEEGIKNAKAVIIVLSTNSVTKKWVREELNASIVRRLEAGTTLIPVIIDDCEVPESLRSTVWVKIDDLKNYDPEFDSVVSAIFDHREKPPLGKPPGYSVILDEPIMGLSRIDTRVLKLFAEEILKPAEFLEFDANTEEIWKKAEAQGIPRQDYLDSLEVLADKRYLDPDSAMSAVPLAHSLTVSGFKMYAESYLSDFDALVAAVASLIVNEEVFLNKEIARRLGKSEVLVTFIMESMKQTGYVDIYWESGGNVTVSAVKPQLRRALRESNYDNR